MVDVIKITAYKCGECKFVHEKEDEALECCEEEDDNEEE